MSQRQGFTLLEVVLVMVIILILATLALPYFEAMYSDMRVQAAADHLRGRFALARTRAIEDGRPYRFAVRPDSSEYRIAPDSGDFWGEGSGGIGWAEDEGLAEPLVLEDMLPEQIIFRLADASPAEGSGWSALAIFLPDGSCAYDSSIILNRDNARPIVISIRGLTGGVTVRPADAEAMR